MAFVSFRKVRGLIVFLPFLNFRIAHSATLDWRDRSLVENSLACARISSRYFGSTTQIMYDRYGKPPSIQAGQKKVDAILNLLVERAPWAIFGYSDELNQTLRTNWGGFVAAVDAKRCGVSSTT
jgi:hypothetical protein